MGADIKKYKREIGEGDSVVVIAGVTGSGKTDYALQFVRNNPNCELVNTDSMQIYKELVVGNNKGTIHRDPIDKFWHYPEAPEVPLWLVNILSIFDPEAANYSVAEFQQQAREKITEILASGHTPVLVGGSGLYLDVVIRDYNFHGNNTDPQVNTPADLNSLYWQLDERDISYDHLNESDIKNPRRLINLLRRGGSVTESTSPQTNTPLKYNLDIHYLPTDFATLKPKLRQRAEQMLPGLKQEVELLLSHYKTFEKIPARIAAASGYKQLLAADSDQKPIDLITNAHYQLARRQEKWFRKYLLSDVSFF